MTKYIPSGIERIITAYVVTPKYNLREWIKMIDWNYLSSNPSDGALDLLETGILPEGITSKGSINWNGILRNTNKRALKLFEKNRDEIIDSEINVTDLLNELKNPIITSYKISEDPNEADFILSNIDKVDWVHLSCNPNDKILDLILSTKRIDWNFFSMNSNDRALDILLNPINKNRIDFSFLSENHNERAIELLSKNQNKIFEPWFFRNPSIFVFDTLTFKNASDSLNSILLDMRW